MDTRLVITDFDGTLVTDEKQITEKNLKALKRLNQKNVLIAIATGRALSSFNRALSDMGEDIVRNLVVDYVLFSTGAGVLAFPNREILYRRSITKENTVRVTRYFDSRGFDYMVHKAVPDTHHLLYKTQSADNTDFQNRLSFYRSHARPLDVFVDQFESVTEVLAVLPDHNGAETVSAIRRDLPEFSVIPATSPLDHQSLWIEVFHKDVSKSRTAAWLCRQLNIPSGQVLAVGNDFNDKDLLKWAGKGIVVDNAPLPLKSRFDSVASNNHSGFANAVAHIG